MGAERPLFWQVLLRETRWPRTFWRGSQSRIDRCVRASRVGKAVLCQEDLLCPEFGISIATITAGNSSRDDNRACLSRLSANSQVKSTKVACDVR